MEFSTDMQIIEFDSFETAFPVAPGDEDAARRRYMTLFAWSDQHAKVGGTSYVNKVTSVGGEPFALKRLLPNAGIPKGATLSDEDTARITKGHASAFYEEYRNQLLVSRLKGFPKLYGYGTIEGDPAILMEWVEGTSLRALPGWLDGQGKAATAQLVAEIGASVLEVLDNLTRLDATLVHRDISPANIIIRTDGTPLEEQVERGRFDICLIDFGSAAAETDGSGDPSFTVAAQVWRNGTPEYAPPEMLTQDIPHIDVLRKSQAIDVFALCSVLYELYAAHTPWRVADNPEISAYRLKTEREPEVVELHDAADETLVRAISRGLAVDQNARPTVRELLGEFYRFLGTDSATGAMEVAGAAGAAQDGPFVDGMPGFTGAAEPRPDGSSKPGLRERFEPPGLYTPDSTRLQVASVAEGGGRASQDIPEFAGEARGISRRGLIVGGVAIAAAAILGGGVATRLFGGKAGSLGGYVINASAVAEGVPANAVAHPVRQIASNEWLLLSGLGSDGRTLKASITSSGREPGRFSCGLVKAFDEASGGYGFKTLVADDAQPDCAWAIGRTFSQAKDFTFADGDSTSEGLRLPGDAAGAFASKEDLARCFAPVQNPETQLWGFIDATGSDRIEARYADAGNFANGHAAVRTAEGEKRWGLVDQTGATVLEPQFLGLGMCSAEGLMAAAPESRVSWGFVGLDGQLVIEAAYTQVRRFTEGFAGFFDGTPADLLAGEGSDARWGFLDASGNVAIEPRFLDVRPFDGGLAPAKDPDTRLWGLIDTTGAWRVLPLFLALGERVGGLRPAHGSPASDLFPTTDSPEALYDDQSAEWEKYESNPDNTDIDFAYGYVDDSGAWTPKPTYADALIRASAQ